MSFIPILLHPFCSSLNIFSLLSTSHIMRICAAPLPSGHLTVTAQFRLERLSGGHLLAPGLWCQNGAIMGSGFSCCKQLH